MESSKESKICAAIEKSLYALWLKIATISGNKFSVSRDFSWVLASNSPWPNYIFNANFAETDPTANIRKIIERIKRKELPPSWLVSATSTPDLRNHLTALGFSQFYQQSGMAIELAANKVHLPPSNSDFAVTTVNKTETLQQWMTLTKECFAGKISHEIVSALFNEDDIVFYAGLYKGTVVTGLFVFFSQDYVSLHFVSTSPSYRKKGLAGILLNTALRDAVKQNYKLAVIHSSPMGEKVYKNLGFEQYLTLYHYRIDMN